MELPGTQPGPLTQIDSGIEDTPPHINPHEYTSTPNTSQQAVQRAQRPQIGPSPTIPRWQARAQRGRQPAGPRKTRASIKVATLNMRGRRHQGVDKWNHVNQIMRDERIGILALQETHLLDSEVDGIHDLFGARMHITSTIDPGRPNAGGVAIVINKYMADTADVSSIEIAPGRALYTTIPWHRNQTLRVLAIYAPNEEDLNKKFWEDLQKGMEGLPKPDIMLGDFNMVEDAPDRLPPHADNIHTVDAMTSFKRDMRLVDGWRHTFPNTLAYTYSQTVRQGAAHSRIDRIYLRERSLLFTNEWNMHTVGLPTDHQMVSVRLSDASLPYIGKGRWTMQLHLMQNDAFLTDAAKLGKTSLHKMEHITERTDTYNSQTIFEEFKKDAQSLAKVATRKNVSTLDRAILEAEELLRQTTNNNEIPVADRKTAVAEVQDQIRLLKGVKHQKTRDAITAKYRLESECATSKTWARSGKERPPRDTIIELVVPGSSPAVYEKRSDKMAEIARNYHENLQSLDIAENREQATAQALDAIKTRITPEQDSIMKTKLTEDEVGSALSNLPNGKATGLNGIPYEFWKALQARHKAAMKDPQGGTAATLEDHNATTHNTTLDVAALLTRVFNDIIEHGIIPGSTFAEGWLCPLYKKNDRRNIANYRPITLLNSDYKLLTKVLSIRLAAPAPHLIHPDQAGFVPGRSIADQIRLTQMIQTYAEMDADGGGIIVGLDQEKAYDKITHDYLWKVLDRFGLPAAFTNTVRTLYENAYTSVMINGELSSKYKVTRGVRQGCPLSCLLFDLAIEPLAQLLRDSDLRGFKTEAMLERAIVTLFADDTTVYLSKYDDISILLDILDTWCAASGAKFNILKTELVPIGPESYREDLLATRKLFEGATPIPSHMNIAKEGEAKRFLGAWIGNGIDQEGIWSIVLDKIQARLDRWERTHPTIEGRRIILQWIVGGMTQYLTNVQGMPKKVEDRLEAICKSFLWDNAGKSMVNRGQMEAPIREGGKKALSVKDRNEAITLTQIKTYLQPNSERAKWALFMDEILSMAAEKSPVTHKSVRVNPFVQAWKPMPSRLPENINRMLKIARKHNVSLDVAELSPTQARSLPIWSHIATTPEMQRLYNYFYGQILRDKHGIRTVGDLEDFIKEVPVDHEMTSTCTCARCVDERMVHRCTLNPSKCLQTAQRLYAAIPDKWRPDACTDEPAPDHPNTFNKSMMATTENILDCIRVFTDTPGRGNAQLPRDIPAERRDGEEYPHILVAVDGKAGYSALGEVVTAAAAITSENPSRTFRYRAKSSSRLQTRDEAELLAALQALRDINTDASVTMAFASKTVHKVLTTKVRGKERRNWHGCKEKRAYQALIAEIRKRAGRTTIAHGTDEDAQTECRQIWEDESVATPTIDLSSHAEFKSRGEHLASATQATLHQGIRSKHPREDRRETRERVAETITAVKETRGDYVPEEAVWSSIRSKTLSKGARGFMWKNLHSAYRLGKKWDVIPGMSARKSCALCGEDESMEHILLNCSESIARRAIWQLAEKLWRLREEDWPPITFGTIMGCNLAGFKISEGAGRGRLDEGKNRLFAIIISESAHLIWKIRCERVIRRGDDPDSWHTEAEVENRWLHIINTRLKLDKLYVNKKAYGRRAIKKATVVKTWHGVLAGDQNLSHDWVWQSGGLVGMVAHRRNGRNSQSAVAG